MEVGQHVEMNVAGGDDWLHQHCFGLLRPEAPLVLTWFLLWLKLLSHYREVGTIQQRLRALQPPPLVPNGFFSGLILCSEHLIAGLDKISHLNF